MLPTAQVIDFCKERRRTMDAKEQILNTAERLFAQQGFATTSLRSLTAAAGVNLAAVNYYFGSKAALSQAVLHRILVPIKQQQLHQLEILASRPPIPLEALLLAFLSPLADLLDSQQERGRVIARLYAQVMSDPSDDIRKTVSEEVEMVNTRFFQAVREALPYLPPDELWWRFRSMIGVVLAHLAGTLLPPQAPEEPTKTEEINHRWLITFLVAALRAPATVPCDDPVLATWNIRSKTEGK
jgi:AcrR family transcriptional regulator